MMETSTVDAPPVSASRESRSFNSFSELICQAMPLVPGKHSFKVGVGQGNDTISLASGQSPVLTYGLPETGFHEITVASAVLHDGKGKEQIFYPQVSLLDREGNVVRTIGAEQVQYQKPGFMADEGVITSFVLDNRVQNPATCMVVYTTDEARKGKTKLVNEAKEYAKVRGTVALPVPDTYAGHGNKGNLTITLKSSQAYTMTPVVAPSVSVVKTPAVLPESDPFNKKVRAHYLNEVGDSLKQGEITKALDKRSELKEIARATEGYFASQYQLGMGQVTKPAPVKSSEGFAEKALHHYQEKIAGYLKAGQASSALKVVDDVRAMQEAVDQLFDRKS
ncbi:MalM family protein [Endozoicomonas sp. Mp262]|uniref:MalM family protein n=1 Tax=Endozoicomonas sp. Mp262 TaxID=2919499 RepID=UPI0021D93D59